MLCMSVAEICRFMPADTSESAAAVLSDLSAKNEGKSFNQSKLSPRTGQPNDPDGIRGRDCSSLLVPDSVAVTRTVGALAGL